MAYTNSKLISYTKLSPNHSDSVHTASTASRHTAWWVSCQLRASADALPVLPDRQAAIMALAGRSHLSLRGEKNRSWCSSSNANDQRAVTIECASDMSEPYAMNSAVYNSLIKLCVDICRRNGKRNFCGLPTRIRL